MSVRELLDRNRCTLIVIDMQNDFCHEEGAAARLGQETEPVRKIVPAVGRLVEAARRMEVPVVFVRVVHDSAFDTSAWMARGRAGKSLDVDAVPIVEEGSWGADFYEGIEPLEGDLVLTKYRYSAFAFTALELALRRNMSDVLLLTGTQTNVCVEATANDAIFEGFHPVLIEDCVASGSAKFHEAAVEDFAERLGSVVASQAILEAWGEREEARLTP